MEDKKLQSTSEEWQKLLPLSEEDRDGIVSAMNTEGKWTPQGRSVRLNYWVIPQ